MPSVLEQERILPGFYRDKRSPETQVLEDELRKQIIESGRVILANQHPRTKLFPAAAESRRELRGHYGDFWVRDGSMVGVGLTDPLVELSIQTSDQSEDRSIASKLREAGRSLAESMIDLFSEPPWQEGFDSNVREAIDSSGQRFFKLLKPAPPTHLKISGEKCDWPHQNQPDSWGEFLIFLTSAVKTGAVSLDARKKRVLGSIASFLSKARVDNLEQASMWEWTEVHHPVPLSSLGICAKGVEDVSPLLDDGSLESGERAEDLRRFVSRAQGIIGSSYPVEYTIREGHVGRADLATLVAHSLDAFKGLPYSIYFITANPELGSPGSNGQLPGRKRYINDHYQRIDGEAIWPMGKIMEAKLYLDRGIQMLKMGSEVLSQRFLVKGEEILAKALELKRMHGYVPELLKQEKGQLVPNENQLLWNEALLMQACARAVLLSRAHGKF